MDERIRQMMAKDEYWEQAHKAWHEAYCVPSFLEFYRNFLRELIQSEKKVNGRSEK